MADRGSTPGPTSEEGEGTENVGEPNQDDPDEGNGSGYSDSDSSDSDSDFIDNPEPCLLWKLNPRDVNPRINQLYLPAQIASKLLANPEEILENPNSRSFWRRLSMTDHLFEYDMVLSSCPRGGVGGFMITRGWSKYVVFNQLQAGDQVAFHRSRGWESDEDYKYQLSCLRSRRINAESTSRCEPVGNPCLSLPLTSPNTTGPIPMLHLSPRDVNLLMGDNMVPGNLLRPFSVDLRVFVHRNRWTISMNLSCKVVHGGRNAIFTLNTNWGIFLRAYDLREGDTVYFFRPSEGDDCNCILTFIKEPRFKTNMVKPTGSSEGPKEDPLCLSRTLTACAVDSSEPALHLDAYEAFLLTGSNDVMEPHSDKYRMKLVAHDDYGVCYKLLLSCFATIGNWEGYSITQDWGEFVRVNDLKAGDEVKFYRKSYCVDGCAFYYLKLVRKPSDGVLTEVEVTGKRLSSEQDGSTDQRKKKAGPGSRVISDDQPMCFSIFLSADEVGSGEQTPKLVVDDRRAGYMIACYDMANKYPFGTLRENLVVYDIDDRKYDMLLTHRMKYGTLVYYLDAGWQRFVEVHCLRAGDAISMFKFIDPTVHDEPFFVIRFKKMGGGGKAGAGGEGGQIRKTLPGVKLV